MILFSGLFKNQQDFPKWIGWIEYLSPYKYAFEALCWNEFEDLDLAKPSSMKGEVNPIKDMGTYKYIIYLFS